MKEKNCGLCVTLNGMGVMVSPIKEKRTMKNENKMSDSWQVGVMGEQWKRKKCRGRGVTLNEGKEVKVIPMKEKKTTKHSKNFAWWSGIMVQPGNEKKWTIKN